VKVPKKVFVVGKLEKTVEVMAGGVKEPATLKWHPGMIGILPVFRTRTAAEAWANGALVIELEKKT